MEFVALALIIMPKMEDNNMIGNYDEWKLTTAPEGEVNLNIKICDLCLEPCEETARFFSFIISPNRFVNGCSNCISINF